MERASRLRRYLRKDYSQTVRFPVEIVGRDGNVRRYSFDDSVRLYQRRIHSAPVRYDDPELVDAEVRHCRQRIDQLRRSYLEHHGVGGLREGRLGGVFGGPLAADVVAFLHRALGGTDGPPELELVPLQGDVADACWVRSGKDGRTAVLYAWRTDERGQAPEPFRDTVRRLAEAPQGDSVERLFAWEEGPDLAMVLAGSGAWDGPAPAPLGRSPTSLYHLEEDAGQAGVRALYDGRVGEALARLEGGLDADPSRLGLAWWAATVALLDAQLERATFAARLGLLNHPGDARLVYVLALALRRSGASAEARALLAATPGRPTLLAVLDTLLQIEAGAVHRAVRAFRALPRGDRPEDPRLEARAAEAIRHLVARHAAVAASGAALLSAGLVATAGGAPEVGAIAMAAGPAAIVAAAMALRRRATDILVGKAGAIPRLVSLDLVPRDRAGDAVQ